MQIEVLYEQRVRDIIKTCAHAEPDHVPVMGNILTWAVGYAGGDTNDLLDHPEKIPEVCTKYFDEVYLDANFLYGLLTPIRALERIGSNAFFVSSDKHTIQHRDHCVMQEDEYDELIRNTEHFLIDVLGKRKFPELRKDPEEVYSALIDVANNIDTMAQANARCIQIGKEKFGIVNIIGGHKVYPTMDVIFDRLRGLKGTMIDMVRRREQLQQAIKALYPIYLKQAENVAGAFPYGFCTLHCPTYLGPKNFEELFWPSMRDMLMEVYNRGSKTLLFMEGTWEPYYEILKRDLPKASVLCMLEDDDITEAKNKIGDRFTILGGVSTSMLRFGTKQECIDETKRIIDICAPGGGFIFTTEKSLCTYGDVNTENLIAVNQFVHDYGKY